MFKKEIKTSSFNRLSNKDRNHLKAQFAKAIDSPAVERFFADNKQLSSKKVVDSHALIYLTEQYPAIIDDGNHKYFPTLYTLALYSEMLPCLILKPSVEGFIMKGANLMWPGVMNISELGKYRAGTIVAIAMHNRVVIGVGEMTASAEERPLEERTGVACTSLHVLGDRLTSTGNEMLLVKAIVAPKKVQEPVVNIPQPTLPKSPEQAVSAEKIGNQAPERPLELERSPQLDHQQYEEEGSWSGSQADEASDDDYYAQSEPIAKEPEEVKKPEPPKLSPSEMSEYFRKALLSAIFVSRPTKNRPEPGISLPIDSGQFFSEFIKRACPQSVGLDIHRSTYKKLSNFYDAMEKEGVLTTKDRKNKGTTVTSITSVNYNLPEFAEFEPLVKRIRVDKQQQPEQHLYPLNIKSDVSSVPMVQPNPKVFWLFAELPNQKIKKQVLEEADFVRNKQEQAKMYTLREVKQRLQAFITRCLVHRSEHPDNKMIDITIAKNPFLFPIFDKEINQRRVTFKEELKYTGEEGGKFNNADPQDRTLRFRLTRNDLQTRVLNAVDHFYTMSFGKDEVPELIKGRMKAIHVLSVKQSNKIVTWITGLQNFIQAKNKEEEIAGFCHYLSVLFACGASYSDFRGGKQIMVQGNFVMKLVKMLQKEYNIPRQFITFVEPKRKGRPRPSK